MLANREHLLAMYLRLADASRRRHARAATARLLVLAANTASELGLDDVAEFCRHSVLRDNPQHMVGHFPSIRVARQDAAFASFVRSLARHYSWERAEYLLTNLGIEMGREHELYADLREYAAALLGTTTDMLTAAQSAPPTKSAENPFAAPPSNEVPRHRLAADPARRPPSAWGNVLFMLIPLILALLAWIWMQWQR
jgi:hypothetical protein